MATQYTPILQLALPVTGELNGTWGDVVNDNITSMVEQAIAGMATISTWTANAHTLTTANGTTDEARCAMLLLQTGSGGTALSGAGQVICPALTKLYVVKNDAAYAVTVKTSGGSGISVSAGDTTFVFCDGTNVVACVTQITNGHITGNLTVDGNTTLGDSSADTVVINAGSTTLNDGGALRFEDNAGGEYVALKAPATIAASFTLTLPIDDGTNGQALITDGSGNLSWSTAASGDVYGPASATDNAVTRFDGTTGKLIQNSGVIIDDSNNITGVAALTASGSVTLSGGTANGVAYLNGSKVLTTGSALTFDGTTFANASSGNAEFAINTASTPILSLVGGSSTIPLIGYKDIGLRFGSVTGVAGAGFSEQMRLTSTGLGIGTSSPSQPLQVTKSQNASTWAYVTNGSNGSGAATGLLFGTDQGTSGAISQNSSGNSDVAANALRVRNLLSAPISFEINSSTKALLDSSGNLGIGTSSPTTKLTLKAASNVPALRIVQDNNENYGYSFQVESTTGGLYLNRFNAGSDTSSLLILSTSGNLGLGVTPSAWVDDKALQLPQGSISSGYEYGISTNANAYRSASNIWRYTNGQAAFRANINNGGFQWFTAPSGTAGSAISFTQAMTLTANGGLLVGGTNENTSRLVDLVSSTKTQLSLTYPGVVTWGIATNSDASISFNNGSERMRIDSSGNLLVGTTSNPNTSLVYAVQAGVGPAFNGVNQNSSFNGTLFYGQTARAASTAFDMIGMYANAVGQFRVSGAGVIYAQNTTVQSISDQRLKENINPASDGLNIIMALRPVRYDWKQGYGNGRKNQLGFIAQEMEAVFPEAVSEWQGITDNDDTIYKTVGPASLIPVLVKSIQELKAELDATKAEVAALKGA